MTMTSFLRAAPAVCLALSFTAAAGPASALDADAAQALSRKSNCTRCHSVAARKEGPSFKETAAKYKGRADAEQVLFIHLTTRPKVKVDGNEEEHDTLKTRNDAEVRNVVQWILAQ